MTPLEVTGPLSSGLVTLSSVCSADAVLALRIGGGFGRGGRLDFRSALVGGAEGGVVNGSVGGSGDEGLFGGTGEDFVAKGLGTGECFRFAVGDGEP